MTVNLALAALALRPIQDSPSETPWTSFSYCSSSVLNLAAISSYLPAAAVSVDRSVLMAS